MVLHFIRWLNRHWLTKLLVTIWRQREGPFCFQKWVEERENNRGSFCVRAEYCAQSGRHVDTMKGYSYNNKLWTFCEFKYLGLAY